MFQTDPGLEPSDTEAYHEDQQCANSHPSPHAADEQQCDSPITSSSCDQQPAGDCDPTDTGSQCDPSDQCENCTADQVDCSLQPAVIDSQSLLFERLSVNCDAPIPQSAADNEKHSYSSIGSDFPPIRLFPSEEISDGEPTVSGLILQTKYRFIFLNRHHRNKQQENGSGDGPTNGPKGRCSDLIFSLPIGCLDAVEVRDNIQLIILTKHVKSYTCTFRSADQTSVWFRRMNDAISNQSKLDNLFCFAMWNSALGCKTASHGSQVHANGSKNGTANGVCVSSNGCPDSHANGGVKNSDSCYGSSSNDTKSADMVKQLSELIQQLDVRLGETLFDEDQSEVAVFKNSADCLTMEYERMKFNDIPGQWRISDLNKDFKVISTYPQYVIVPAGVPDHHLKEVSSFRSFRRIASVVWRSQKNGNVIARSSQPEVGWFGWRSSADETMLDQLVKSCISPAISFSSKKLLIIDARSYAAAVANRAKGGGCECPEYYTTADVTFMGLANIHSIRRSFQSLRSICQNPVRDSNLWATLVDSTRWLHHISGLLKSALVVVQAIAKEERPVLVHCSDGWDRTPQITSLAQLLLDPYYRTMDGFAVLVQREWIEFGHKFSERCVNAPLVDPNERCPVFLQWVDCVHQILHQFPSAFEFDQQYLIELVIHVHSCLFGTFMCSNMSERMEHHVQERSFSLWSFLSHSRSAFRNPSYRATDTELRPLYGIEDMVIWEEVYVQGRPSVTES